MIQIIENLSDKLPSYTSLYLKLQFYNQDLFRFLSQIEDSYYDTNNNGFEILPNKLYLIINKLIQYDQVELITYTENINKKYQCDQNNFKIKPYSYQLDGINYGLNKNQWLLLDDQGLGKTLQMIYLSQELKERENIQHCLIICGINSLKYNWANEIKKFSNLSYRVLGEYTTKTGKTKMAPIQKRLEELKENIDEFFVIINKEIMQNKDFLKIYQKSKNKFDIIILDEAHKLVSPTSLSAKALLKLQAKYKVALSGTIIMNVPENTYVSLKWTNNIKSTFTQFKHTYNVYGGFGGISVIGYKNLEILQELISKCSLRRLKTDELKDLPEKTFIDEYVDLLTEQQKLYDNVEVGILEELNKLDHIPTIIEELTINMRLRQISAYPGILSEEVQQSAKLDRLAELVENIVAQGDKVVIFNTFKEAAKKEFELFSKYNPVFCTGDQSEVEIDNNKKIFNSDDNCKVMICTWQKMGTGHTLTSANYCIFVDTPWTWADFNQAADRIHRIGQNKHVFIITLISKNTYDERVKEIMLNKKNLSDYVIDNKN